MPPKTKRSTKEGLIIIIGLAIIGIGVLHSQFGILDYVKAELVSLIHAVLPTRVVIPPPQPEATRDTLAVDSRVLRIAPPESDSGYATTQGNQGMQGASDAFVRRLSGQRASAPPSAEKNVDSLRLKIEREAHLTPEDLQQIDDLKNAGTHTANQGRAERFFKFLQQSEKARYIAQKRNLWKSYLQDTPDPEYVAFAKYYLALALTAAADSSHELLQLAEAVDFYEQNADILRPLMGRTRFEKELNALRRELRDARVRR